MRIQRLVDQPDRAAVEAAIDVIFFEASSVKAFADAATRAAFRHRWLGLYLDTWPELTWIARTDDGTIAGYLVGCLSNPATDARFADLTYFRDFAAACAAYPAHLHINLASACRGQGIGGRLIDAFADHVHEVQLPGLHVVTGRGARNVGFYRQQGFAVVAEAPWKAGTAVLMGRFADPSTTIS